MNSTQSNHLPNIILGSTSVFRKQLLEKLQIPFEQSSPEIDETPLTDETPIEMVKRLSRQKAFAIAEQHPNSIIIASDQCATFNGRIIGKPLTYDKACQQLATFSGNTVTFFTGLCVFDTRNNKQYETVDTTLVHFRKLSNAVIKNYILRDNPLNCAGSFKSEGLGITLFSKIETDDPNALIGLPLIKLTDFFAEIGITLPLETT